MEILDKQIKLAKYLIKTNGGESELLPLLEELKQRRDNDKVLRDALEYYADMDIASSTMSRKGWTGSVARVALEQVKTND